MRDWRGPVALVLAVGVSIALVAGVLLAELTPGPVTTQEVGLFSTLAGAIVGAVATYLGSLHRHERKPMQEQTETEAPEREGDEPVEPEPVPVPSEPVEPEPTVEPEPEQDDDEGE